MSRRNTEFEVLEWPTGDRRWAVIYRTFPNKHWSVFQSQIVDVDTAATIAAALEVAEVSP